MRIVWRAAHMRAGGEKGMAFIDTDEPDRVYRQRIAVVK
jgi:hypothetical protein